MTLTREEESAVLLMTSLGQTLLVFTVLTLVLRLGTRVVLLRRISLDDLAIVLASGAGCAGLVTSWRSVKPLEAYYNGDEGYARPAKQYILASSFLYIWTMTLVKISLGFFFYRIFSAHLKRKITIIAAVFTATILGTVYFTIGASTCSPGAYFFKEPNCSTLVLFRNVGRVWGVQNVVTDLVFPALSFNAIRRSDLTNTTKIFAFLLVCIAVFGSVASVIRLAMLAPATQLSDFTRIVHSAVWTQLEAGIAIACANIACLRPLGRLMLELYRNRLGSQENWTEFLATEDMEPFSILVSFTTILWRLNGVFPGNQSSTSRSGGQSPRGGTLNTRQGIPTDMEKASLPDSSDLKCAKNGVVVEVRSIDDECDDIKTGKKGAVVQVRSIDEP